MKKLIALTLFLLVTFIPYLANAQATECLCVAEARRHVPLTPRLDAKWWSLLPQETRSAPIVGSIVLMKYEKSWDVAVVKGYGAKGFIVAGVDFDTCNPTTRVIAYNDTRIKAFFDFRG